jgi:hypothetical protein
VTRALFARLIGVLALIASPRVEAEPLALLAPGPTDDARQAVALGPHGEVYAPDGKGAWVRTQRITTVDTLAVAGRAAGAVVASGEGVVYKLAPNGWSAIRLHQKDKAVMASGPRAVAAVNRQLYALHLGARGEPEKLALAPSPILAIGAGKTIVIAMASGLARVDRKKLEPIAGAPKQVLSLVDDRWAIVATGAFDLRARKPIAWPGSTVTAATVGPTGNLVAVARRAGKLELLTVEASVVREALDAPPSATAVGIVVDRANRVAIALADGRILTRDRGSWTTTSVVSRLPDPRPGAGPARSP